MATDPQKYAEEQSARATAGRWLRMCQSFVANALTGRNSGYEDANAGYAALSRQSTFYRDYVPPVNTPVYWTGGKNGHVALSAGDGYAWTNDFRGPGKISRESISDINQWLGSSFTYQGFTTEYQNADGSGPTQRAGRMPGASEALSDTQIYLAARHAGFNKAQARTMTAIAIKESGGKTRATNDTRGRKNLPSGHSPEYSLGLWQINVLANKDVLDGNDPASLYDPLQNAKAAKRIFDRQGFSAWSVYKNRSIWKD